MDMIKCPYCQQEIPAGSKFCPECGKNLRDIPPAPVPSPVTPDNDTTPPPVKVQPVNDSTLSANNNAVPYMGTQPKGKKGLIAFLIIGVIVIIGVFLASHGSANSLFGCKHENTEVLASKTATCTGAGLTEGLKCADCGKVLKEQERIDPLGHTKALIPPITPKRSAILSFVQTYISRSWSFRMIGSCSLICSKSNLGSTPLISSSREI